MDKNTSEVGTKTSAKGAVSEAAAPLVKEIMEGAQADFAGAQDLPKEKPKPKEKEKEEKKARYVDHLNLPSNIMHADGLCIPLSSPDPGRSRSAGQKRPGERHQCYQQAGCGSQKYGNAPDGVEGAARGLRTNGLAEAHCQLEDDWRRD